MSTTAPSGEWINGKQARQILGGCGITVVQRFALLGRIRTHVEVGFPVRYFRPDVEAVAAARESHAGNFQLAGA